MATIDCQQPGGSHVVTCKEFCMQHQPVSVLANAPDQRTDSSRVEVLAVQVCSSSNLSLLCGSI